MARDIFIRLNRCHYCNRPGLIVWDTDLSTCNEEVCKSLAFGELRRRHKDGAALPEKRLARALLNAYDTTSYAIRLDERAGAVQEDEAARMRDRDRQETAWLLSELRELERRYPARARKAAPPRRRRSNPRFRRFVARGRTVPLHRAAA